MKRFNAIVIVLFGACKLYAADTFGSVAYFLKNGLAQEYTVPGVAPDPSIAEQFYHSIRGSDTTIYRENFTNHVLEYLYNDIFGGTWPDTVGKLSPEDKKKLRILFDSMLVFSKQLPARGLNIDSSKNPYFGPASAARNSSGGYDYSRDQSRDPIDTRLLIYLTIFGPASIEGKFFTKLYLDWLVAQKGIKSEEVQDFFQRYNRWIDRISGTFDKDATKKFVAALIASPQPIARSSTHSAPTPRMPSAAPATLLSRPAVTAPQYTALTEKQTKPTTPFEFSIDQGNVDQVRGIIRAEPTAASQDAIRFAQARLAETEREVQNYTDIINLLR